MAARAAIRREGDHAENEFRRLVPRAEKSDDQKSGDARLLVDGTVYYLEIKQCHSNTVNQVRAIKFIPLVILAPKLAPRWIVLPPQEVVRLVAGKSRGQHTEIPFESANLSLTGIPERFRCSDADLPQRVIDSIQGARRYAAVEAELRRLQAALVDLKSRVREQILQALDAGDRG